MPPAAVLPDCAALIAAFGSDRFVPFFWLGLLIADECDAERYEWAAFWRDEAYYLLGEL